jgi:hypothetical protein
MVIEYTRTQGFHIVHMDGCRSEVALTVITDYPPISDMNQGDPSLWNRIGRQEGISTLLRHFYADGDLVKVLSWYDNEWGYVSQMIRYAVRLVKTHRRKINPRRRRQKSVGDQSLSRRRNL